MYTNILLVILPEFLRGHLDKLISTKEKGSYFLDFVNSVVCKGWP